MSYHVGDLSHLRHIRWTRCSMHRPDIRGPVPAALHNRPPTGAPHGGSSRSVRAAVRRRAVRRRDTIAWTTVIAATAALLTAVLWGAYVLV
jgi:hypothetical protein